jgi:hypothetical protein
MKGKQIWLRTIRRLLPTSLASTLVSLSLAPAVLATPAELVTSNADSRIYVRLGPGGNYDVRHWAYGGDRVNVLLPWEGSDGYTWYFVEFEESRALGWIREDLVQVGRFEIAEAEESDRRPVRRPTPAPQPVSAPAPTLARIEPPPSSLETYSQSEIDYFLEIALGSEFGSANSVVKKWQEDIRIGVHGSPTAEDMRTLNAVVNELNDLIDGISLEITDRNSNIDIHFAPESQFRSIEPNYRPRNMGFFWTWWRNYSLNRARILISTEGVTQAERSHLIREELTQSLGLMQDSRRYSDSIFYQGWTSTNQYSDLDRAVISMLYRTDITPGMTRSQVQASLSGTHTVQLQTPQREISSLLAVFQQR